MKNNPLFVDSTKLHGDSICSLVELTGACVYPNEQVFIRFVNHQKREKRMPLVLKEDGSLTAHIWLHHQQPITYQFVIFSDDRPRFASAPSTTTASYMLIEEWEPAQNSAQAIKAMDQYLPPEEPSHPESPEVPANFASKPSAKEGLSSILEKWGL